jgi:hypothetical protein
VKPSGWTSTCLWTLLRESGLCESQRRTSEVAQTVSLIVVILLAKWCALVILNPPVRKAPIYELCV